VREKLAVQFETAAFFFLCCLTDYKVLVGFHPINAARRTF